MKGVDMKKLTFLALIAIASFTVSGCGGATEPAADSGVASEAPSDLKPAPEFSLENVAGGMFTSDDLKGKVAIVDFWATWCAPCIEEIPNYNEISAKYADKGVVLVGVTLESGSLEEVKPKVSEFNMKYPVIMGDDKLVEGFGGVLGFPTTFVLTQDGKIYQKYLGLRTNKRELLEKDIEALLAQPGAEVSAVESPSHPM
jgi:thiol-disulfide isomerase/thioredoxin